LSALLHAIKWDFLGLCGGVSGNVDLRPIPYPKLWSKLTFAFGNGNVYICSEHPGANGGTIFCSGRLAICTAEWFRGYRGCWRWSQRCKMPPACQIELFAAPLCCSLPTYDHQEWNRFLSSVRIASVRSTGLRDLEEGWINCACSQVHRASPNNKMVGWQTRSGRTTSLSLVLSNNVSIRDSLNSVGPKA